MRRWGIGYAQRVRFEDSSREENSQEDVLTCDPALVGVFNRDLFETIVVIWWEIWRGQKLTMVICSPFAVRVASLTRYRSRRTKWSSA